MKSKLFALALMVVLTATTAAPLAAAPLLAPCAPGAAYDPACDVNHDGIVDVIDIQLTAAHWNQTGTFASDNDHDHFGQTWTGNDNPLVLQGSFGSPTWAPLILGNSGGPGVRVNAPGGSGLWVEAAGNSGVLVDSAGNSGVRVTAAGNDGLFVCHTGTANTCSPLSSNNGVEIGNAEDDGVRVSVAGDSGLYVGNAIVNGVDVVGDNLAGYFFGPVQITGGCTGCLLATFGVNADDKPLAPGDIVSLAGLRASGVDSVPMLIEVRTAAGGDAVVGIVQGWAELVTEDEPRPTEIGLRLVPREGPASPGQYVTIAYSGLMEVKVSGPITQGSKLAVGTDGAARALRTVNLDGMALAENASVIGVALESLDAGDGLVWVLVNPQ